MDDVRMWGVMGLGELGEVVCLMFIAPLKSCIITESD